jgi:hypothetical protein
MSAQRKTEQKLEPLAEPTDQPLEAAITDHARHRWCSRVAPNDADIHGVPRHDQKQTIEVAWLLGDPVRLPEQNYHWARRVDPRTVEDAYIEMAEPAFMIAVDTRNEANPRPATVATVMTHTSGERKVDYEFLDDV